MQFWGLLIIIIVVYIYIYIFFIYLCVYIYICIFPLFISLYLFVSPNPALIIKAPIVRAYGACRVEVSCQRLVCRRDDGNPLPVSLHHINLGVSLNPESNILNPETPTQTPKVGKIMAQNREKAIILHTFGVQVTSTSIPPLRPLKKQSIRTRTEHEQI